MRIVFVGGLFPDVQRKEILERSKGVIQNAADSFQFGLLKGLDAVVDDGIEILNLPFVGSYPARYTHAYFPGCFDKLFKKTSVKGIGFLNISIIKHFSRFFSLLNALRKIRFSSDDVLMMYSVHLPFLAAAYFLKKIRKPYPKVCLIVPDLPEHMSDSKDILYRLFKRIDVFLIDKLLGSVDCYVLLTSAMAERLGVTEQRFVVVEGVAVEPEVHADQVESDRRIVFYSGTLARRYGVCDLVSAFREISAPDCELWICGDGDSREYIESVASQDPRVKYLGQLPRDQVIKIQHQATLLVNPRSAEGLYTRYSFPSKIMEYMVSGRPVVMHRLPGVPAEYYDHCYAPRTGDTQGLKECLRHVLSLDEDKLIEVGSSAKRFILENKSSTSQGAKIKDFLKRVLHEE
ncbi:glycosyltransferase family 4 protein [Pseudomonas sp. BN414]|uniref:glycosyltransferase n=1 Tax=Pseudomonas sp. BN414 TaxID=2567888 RepID=UPI00245649D2|nr:glycosyltransferase [Pseudomonas sp. BN414]MDH4568828.1 glycosyltransferase family 4 protein [Pseudomonas sp. BN414]